MATALARFNGCTRVYASPPLHEKGATFLLPKSASFYTRLFSAFSLPAMASLPPSSSQTMAPENDNSLPDFYQQIQSHLHEQAAAIQLTPVEEVRTVLDCSVRGMLSTFSAGLLGIPRCSLLVARDPEDRTDLVINFHRHAISVSGKDNEAARNAYLKRHPNSFGSTLVIFNSFKVVRYVSWVATALLGSGEFDPETYKAAKVNPTAQFSNRVASHMNKDQADKTRAIVQHSTSAQVDFAYILDLDSLGFYVKAGYQGQTFKLRIPFPRRAEDRKDVQTLIVEMLEAAKASI